MNIFVRFFANMVGGVYVHGAESKSQDDRKNKSKVVDLRNEKDEVAILDGSIEAERLIRFGKHRTVLFHPCFHG